jgi:tRNA G18 (ribose-2'-O)-methylase SpoU
VNKQHTHKSAQFKTHSFPITVVCDNLRSPSNLGSLFRLCDAFGLKNIILCGAAISLDSPRLRKTARNTQSSLSIEQWDSTTQFLQQLELDKYLSIALEHSTHSSAISHFLVNSSKPLLLFIGNEQNGLSQQVLDCVSHTVHIDMYGLNSSMNVIQATAIALHELTQKLLGQR